MITHDMRRGLGRRTVGLFAAVLLGAAALGWVVFASHNSGVPLMIGEKQYTVRVVSTAADREKGLSGTKSLPEDQGMLFVFKEDGQWGIWMKDMNYPIDIVWLDQSKTVVHIVKGATPESYPSTTFRSEKPARYVLELPAGSVSEGAITLGSRAEFSLNGGERE